MSAYLILADISGYTKFLTGTELEHSDAIVTELTKLIRSRLVPPMLFVKLEGDAVFCFSGADAFPDGEQVLELAESRRASAPHPERTSVGGVAILGTAGPAFGMVIRLIGDLDRFHPNEEGRLGPGAPSPRRLR